MRHFIKLLTTGLMTTVLLWTFPSRADDAAGIVIIASGQVQAVQSDNATRKLRRRSPFYAGEVIRVAANGKAQIRFADGTLLSLRPDTELRVDAFHYEPNSDGSNDKNFFTLLKGGFRTITGAVGHRHPGAYRVNTPVATIGVRGTTYSVAMDKQLYVGVWQGGVTVKNDKGKLDLGMNAAYNFAQIAGNEQTPKGLMTPPPILMDRGDNATAPQSAPPEKTGESRPNQSPSSKDTPKAATGPTPPQGSANGQANGAAPKPVPGTVAQALPKNADLPPPPGITSPNGSNPGTMGPPRPPLPMVGALNPVGSTATAPPPGGTLLTQTSYTDLNNDGVPDLLSSSTATTTTTTSSDPRLSSTDVASLDRLGVFIPGGNPGPYPLTLAKANNGSGGAPLFVWNGLLPSDPNFATAAPIDVIRIGSATPTGVQTHPTYPVSWGAWDGQSIGPAIVQTSATDPTITTPLATQVFWITAIPTVPSVISGLSGKTVYKNVINYQGGASTGTIGAFYVANIVDFGTGAVQGDMYIHTAPDYWDMKYSGSVNGNLLNLTTDSVNSKLYSAANGTQSANGTIKAFFTGTNAEALAGAFDFQTTSGPLADTDGTFVLDNTPVGDLRLTAAEQASIDRVGLAVVDDMSSIDPMAGKPLLANASDGASGSPILVDPTLSPAGFPVHIMRQGLSALTNPQANFPYTRPNDSVGVTLPVSWGSWNENLADVVLDQNNPDDPLLNGTIARPVNWMTVMPTPTTSISLLSGSISYNNLLGLTGTSSGGPIIGPPSATASATVDFTNSTVSGNLSFNTSAGDAWNSSFSGTLSGATLNLNSAGGSVTAVTPVSGFFTTSGNFNGYMTGPKAEGMAGAFDLEASGNPAIHAEGTFLLGCSPTCP